MEWERRVRVNSGEKRRKKAVEYVRKRTLNEDKNTYNIQATCGVRINYDKVIMREIFEGEVTCGSILNSFFNKKTQIILLTS